MQIDGGRPADGESPGALSKLILVHDQTQECPYLDNRLARMPLRLPIGKLDGDELDELLAHGYRRTGDFLYRTECPACQSCEPTRVIVDRFEWTTSLRRVLRRGDADLTAHVGPVLGDPTRVSLFNRHRQIRELDRGDPPVEANGYLAFLVESCCRSVELSIRHQDRLIAVSIIDIGRRSLSAVYTHFDPEWSRYSLGTYAVLKQIEYACETGRPYVYLGMYVAENRHLNYKSRFGPQQRFVDGRWQDR